MPKTVQSSDELLCPVAEFLRRVSRATVAQLAADEDEAGDVVPVAFAALPANENVLAALKDASGLLESAAFVGERYSPDDLEALAAADGTNAQALLFRIITDFAWVLLWERRPNKNVEPPPSLDRSQAFLEQLSQGRRIFGFQEAAEAGRIGHEVVTREEVEERNGVTYQARRWLGTRADRDGR